MVMPDIVSVVRFARVGSIVRTTSVSRACMAAIRRSALPGAIFPEKSRAALAAEPKHQSPLSWFSHQPYLLLSLTSLFWAGNIVLARHVAGHVPPMTLSCVRWIGAFFILLPFARPYLARDWPRETCGHHQRLNQLPAQAGTGRPHRQGQALEAWQKARGRRSRALFATAS